MRALLIILPVLTVVLPVSGQKNIIPAGRSEILGLSLPVDTRQDKRLLVVAAAATLAEREARTVGMVEKQTEVFILPAPSGDWTIAGIPRLIEQAGWRVLPMASTGFYQAVREGRNIIFFLEVSGGKLNFYVSGCVAADIPETAQAPATASAEVQQPTTITARSTTSLPADCLGTWIKSGTVNYNYYSQAVPLSSGYLKDQYTFNADGTYTFLAKSVVFSDDKILLVRENGTYSVNGNQLTVLPASSRMERWSKKDRTDKFGQLVQSQERSRETATYTFTLHYFQGIQEWNLVLQAGAPTVRDGPFGNNQTYINAWYFKRPSPTMLPVDSPY